MKNYIALLLLLFLLQSAFSQEDTTAIKDSQQETTAPVITLSPSELEADESSQDISGLLSASRDIFVSTAGYTFGSTRFRIRGLDSEYFRVAIDGVPVNDMETGRVYWSTWGGLNDATRNKVVKNGLTPVDYGFGGLGGSTNIITRASEYRKQVKLTYSLANRSYDHRFMVIASTGLMPNGWAMTFSASRRFAQNGYVEGTFYDAYGYFLSVEKKFNNQHSLGLTAFGAPIKRGKPGVSTQEAYDLAGSNYYNSYWGYQDGEKRNARVNYYHKPMAILTHYWDMSKSTTMKTSAFWSFGRGGGTALGWYDAADPRPDYYRYLPSYWEGEDEDEYNYYLNGWTGSKSFRQLDWDYFYFANKKNLYLVEDVDGVEGKDVEGNLSKYFIEERRNDHNQLGMHSVFEHEFNKHLNISTGFNVKIHKGYHFKVMDDLLGGDFWVDLDKFAERDFEDPEKIQSDLRHPNNLIYEGDRFGYDYTANVNDYEIFGLAEFTYSKVDFYGAATGKFNQFWRTGNMQNGKFPENSYGDSEKQEFLNGGFKTGITYKITGRHFIDVNGAYLAKAPNFRASFLSARTRNEAVEGLKNEKVLTGDLSYIVRTPFIKSRATVYYTKITDKLWSRSFYHDQLQSFVNYIMQDVDQLNMGAEIGVEMKLNPVFTLTGVWAKGQYLYDSRPSVTITQDNDAELLAEDQTVYLENYRIGGFPQTAGSVGLKFYSPKIAFGGINFNYFDDIYLSINPDRRTEEAVAGFDSGSEIWNAVLDQEKLDPGTTLDFWIGRSWYIGDQYLLVTFSVNNVLDETDFIMGGFEQLRYDKDDVYKFPPKYFYLYGRTFYLNFSLRI